MNEHILSKMADPIHNFHLPRYQEIPDVGLYLEQTAKYIDSYLSPLEDISITGSMISNYVKKKIINKPRQKAIQPGSDCCPDLYCCCQICTFSGQYPYDV